jgi:hypothetical protein
LLFSKSRYSLILYFRSSGNRKYKIKLYQLFENNNFINKDTFETKYGCKINFLNYAKLRNLVKKLITTDEGEKDINEVEEPPYFKSHFYELFGRTTKGSQIFRKILKYDIHETPIYDTGKWSKKLNTSEICQGEIRNAYKSIQNKYLPRQVLDFKARLVFGKTQFDHSLAQWTQENISPICITCLDKGIIANADMLHTLYACPVSLEIHDYIRRYLTNLEEITPISVILTNNRCTKQVNMKGVAYKQGNKAHTVCSIYEESYEKSTALDFIFTLGLKYIMDCRMAKIVPFPKDALVTVLGELRAYVKTRPNQLISVYLKRNIKFLEINTKKEINSQIRQNLNNIAPFHFIKPHLPDHPDSYQNKKKVSKPYDQNTT